MDFFNWIHSPEAWIALGTLTVLEIVLGIDNIIFITILVAKLPAEQRQRGRVLGLGMAMVTRIALCYALAGSCTRRGRCSLLAMSMPKIRQLQSA